MPSHPAETVSEPKAFPEPNGPVLPPRPAAHGRRGAGSVQTCPRRMHTCGELLLFSSSRGAGRMSRRQPRKREQTALSSGGLAAEPQRPAPWGVPTALGGGTKEGVSSCLRRPTRGHSTRPRPLSPVPPSPNPHLPVPRPPGLVWVPLRERPQGGVQPSAGVTCLKQGGRPRAARGETRTGSCEHAA